MQNLFDHFSSLGENSSNENKFDPRDTGMPENDKINYPFTKAEILDVIGKLVLTPTAATERGQRGFMAPVLTVLGEARRAWLAAYTEERQYVGG